MLDLLFMVHFLSDSSTFFLLNMIYLSYKICLRSFVGLCSLTANLYGKLVIGWKCQHCILSVFYPTLLFKSIDTYIYHKISMILVLDGVDGKQCIWMAFHHSTVNRTIYYGTEKLHYRVKKSLMEANHFENLTWLMPNESQKKHVTVVKCK